MQLMDETLACALGTIVVGVGGVGVGAYFFEAANKEQVEILSKAPVNTQFSSLQRKAAFLVCVDKGTGKEFLARPESEEQLVSMRSQNNCRFQISRY